MKMILDLLKTLCKIFILYIVIGFVAVIIIYFAGVFESLILKDTLGNMQLADYVVLRGYAEILWLPLVIGILVSKATYFPNPVVKIRLGIIVAVFMVSVIAISSKE